jgi:hypothetical protein
MADITWPGYRVIEFELRLMGNYESYPNPVSKDEQVIDELGDYWMAALMAPAGTDDAEGSAWEALWDSLLGKINRLALWHVRRPAPLGTARGSMTLSANAAQFATALAVTGARTRNLISYAGFELDSNSDGLSDGWLAYSTGTTGTIATIRIGGNGSAWGQRITATGLGTLSSDRIGVHRVETGMTPATVYTFAADVFSGTAAQVYLQIDWQDSGGAFISSSSAASAIAAGGTWTRKSATFTSPAGAARANCYIWLTQNASLSAALIDMDNVQLEAAAAATAYQWPPTLKVGDMLGVGGLLLRTKTDTTFDDSGAATVPITARLRNAQSSGAAVTWDKPTALFRLVQADSPGVNWRSNGFDGSARIDLIEA